MNGLSTLQTISICLGAFGLGYAAGAIQRIFRQAVEVLD